MYKHISANDSEVMQEFTKIAKAKGLIKQDTAIQRAVRAVQNDLQATPKKISKTSFVSTGNFGQDMLKLCDGLRETGLVAQAETVEKLFLSLNAHEIGYKKAQTYVPMYGAWKETGEDLLNEAHPEGSVEMAEAGDELGVVEDKLEQHKKIKQVVEKDPTGKLASLDDFGRLTSKAQVLATLKMVLGAPAAPTAPAPAATAPAPPVKTDLDIIQEFWAKHGGLIEIVGGGLLTGGGVALAFKVLCMIGKSIMGDATGTLLSSVPFINAIRTVASALRGAETKAAAEAAIKQAGPALKTIIKEIIKNISKEQLVKIVGKEAVKDAEKTIADAAGEATETAAETGAETGAETAAETGAETAAETAGETAAETAAETVAEVGAEVGTEAAGAGAGTGMAAAAWSGVAIGAILGSWLGWGLFESRWREQDLTKAAQRLSDECKDVTWTPVEKAHVTDLDAQINLIGDTYTIDPKQATGQTVIDLKNKISKLADITSAIYKMAQDHEEKEWFSSFRDSGDVRVAAANLIDVCNKESSIMGELLKRVQESVKAQPQKPTGQSVQTVSLKTPEEFKKWLQENILSKERDIKTKPALAKTLQWAKEYVAAPHAMKNKFDDIASGLTKRLSDNGIK